MLLDAAIPDPDGHGFAGSRHIGEEEKGGKRWQEKAFNFHETNRYK
jgi:hypothetical protein